MRAFFLASLLAILALSPTPLSAGDRPSQKVVLNGVTVQATNSYSQTYRGYYLDLSGIAERQDFAALSHALRHQVDIVEGVGLSPRVLHFFQSVPVLVDEFACMASHKAENANALVVAAGCYNPSAAKIFATNSPLVSRDGDPTFQYKRTMRGIVMVRPGALESMKDSPLVLHELLHAYHYNVFPESTKDNGVLFHYNEAKNLYSAEQPIENYAMSNEREFFAVTASVFLYGKDRGFVRSKIKEKQADYYKFLVWLFGFDPDRAPSAVPVASAK